MLNLTQRIRARRFRRLRVASEFDCPEHNLVLTGLSRSGTSLLSSIISGLPNAYCANEIFYDVTSLPRDLAKVRMCLTRGLPVPNKFNAEGVLTTNTAREEVEIRYHRLRGDFDRHCLVATNANIPYLDRIQQLMSYDYRLVAMVREPSYTIASWNSPKVRGFPEYRVTDEDCHPRWSHLDFSDSDRIERQIVIWRHYADLIRTLGEAGKLSVVCYEDVVDGRCDLDAVFHRSYSDPRTAPALRNMNQRSRYADVEFDRIGRSVVSAGIDAIYADLYALAGASRKS